MNKMLRGMMRYARDLDRFTEDVLDQTMCTEVCPCYTERIENPMQNEERDDAWFKYSSLP